MKLIHYLFLAATLVVPVVGCSSDSKDDNDGNGNGNGNEVPATAEADISAASGGEVTLGEAALTIPAGALAADTKITVESKEPASSLPDQATLKGLTYEFGPDGTTFSKPVSLTLPLPSTPGEGEEAVVSWLDTTTNKWVDLSTTVSGGDVKADVEHFTMFVVRLRGVAAIDCSFAACGGNVVGEWDIQGACVEVSDEDNPFLTACPTATIDIGLDVAGSVVFTEGTYTTTFTGTNALTIGFPVDCITSNFGGSITSCDQFGDELEDEDNPEKVASCTGSITTICTCTIEEAVDPTPKTGTYTKNGNFITMQDDGESAEDTEPNEYCVSDSDSTLKIALKEGGKTSAVISAIKK